MKHPLLLTFLLVLLMPTSSSATQVGVAAAVRGNVKLARGTSIGHIVKSGEPIEMGDEIKTGKDSGMQVLLLDETVFTLGANSSMVIDEFVYKPGTADGKIGAKLLKGTFRFISGKVAKEDPDDMKVDVPSGTIGVRGTIVFAQVNPETDQSLIVLGGPGALNNAGIKQGSIAVSNVGVTRDVLRTGWGVEIPDGQSPPTEPFLVPETVFENFHFESDGQNGGPPKGEAHTRGGKSDPKQQGGPPGPGHKPGPPPNGHKPNGPDPKGNAGQNGNGGPNGHAGPNGSGGTQLASHQGGPPPGGPMPPPPGGNFGGDFMAGAEFSGQMGEEGAFFHHAFHDASHTIGEFEQYAGNNAEEFINQQFQLARVDDLAQFAIGFNGVYTYSAQDIPLNGPQGGHFDLDVALDFSAHSVKATFTDLVSPFLGSTGGGTSVDSFQSFGAGLGGNATYVMPIVTYNNGSGCSGAGCNIDMRVDVFNKETEIADSVAAGAIIIKNATSEMTGGHNPQIPRQ